MALQDNPTLSNMKNEIENKVNKSGDTLTGQLVLSENGFKTYDEKGYYLDRYGNFVHTTTIDTNTFNIQSYSNDVNFKVNFENGNVNSKGYYNTENQYGYRITRSDLDSASTSLPSSIDTKFSLVDKNNRYLAFVEMGQNSDGDAKATLMARKYVNNANKDNWVCLRVNNSGNPIVSFNSTATIQAWRTGLGFTSSVSALSGGNDVSLSSSTTLTSVYTFTISDPGVYILRYSVSFPNNNTGYRQISLYNETLSSDTGYVWAVSVPAATSTRTTIGATNVIYIGTPYTFKVQACQNSGSTLKVSPRVTYHKLHDI